MPQAIGTLKLPTNYTILQPAGSSLLPKSHHQQASKRTRYTIEDSEDKNENDMASMPGAIGTSKLPANHTTLQVAGSDLIPKSRPPQSSKRAHHTIDDSADENENDITSTAYSSQKKATRFGTFDIPISDDRLFNITATTEEVLEDRQQAFPLLHASTNPQIERFNSAIQSYLAMCSPPTFPVQNPDMPPDVNPELDIYWAKCVREEPKLIPGTYHEGLDMDPRLIVKPWETMQSAVVALSSYPTIQTTVHLHNGIIRDVSNPSTAAFLAKLGYYNSGTRSKPMLFLDLFPRRLDRRVFTTTDSEELFKKLPQNLVGYWSSVALN